MAETREGTTARRPRRGWYQLSLRTFLVVVALVAVILGTQYRRNKVTARNVSNLRQVAQLNKDVWQIAWSPDRSRWPLVGWESPVEIRDAYTLDLLETIGTGKKIIHFAFSPIKDIVAFCENGPTAEILDKRTERSVVLNATNDQPQMIFSPDGKLLVTGGYGSFVRVWRTSDGQLLRTCDLGNVAGGLTVAFSPDGKLLAVGNRNSSTRVFDAETGELYAILPKQSSHDLKFHPRGHTLAVSYADGTIALWRVADGKLLCERNTGAEEIYTLDWSPDGEMLATGGLKGKITLWNGRDLSVLHQLPAPEWVIGVKFTPDGMNLLCAGGSRTRGGKRELQVWGIEGALYSWLHRSSR